MKKQDVLKLILLFFGLSKQYARLMAGTGGTTYEDDGNGNITIEATTETEES